MKEEILQYIWKFQNYNNNELQCSNGDPVFSDSSRRTHNLNQGPDFKEAKIEHLNSSH